MNDVLNDTFMQRADTVFAVLSVILLIGSTILAVWIVRRRTTPLPTQIQAREGTDDTLIDPAKLDQVQIVLKATYEHALETREIAMPITAVEKLVRETSESGISNVQGDRRRSVSNGNKPEYSKEEIQRMLAALVKSIEACTPGSVPKTYPPQGRTEQERSRMSRQRPVKVS